MTCKRCLRPYVNAFAVKIDFPFCKVTLDWEGCADCAYQLKRQLVDFMLTATKPTKKAQSRDKYLKRIAAYD